MRYRKNSTIVNVLLFLIGIPTMILSWGLLALWDAHVCRLGRISGLFGLVLAPPILLYVVSYAMRRYGAIVSFFRFLFRMEEPPYRKSYPFLGILADGLIVLADALGGLFTCLLAGFVVRVFYPLEGFWLKIAIALLSGFLFPLQLFIIHKVREKF